MSVGHPRLTTGIPMGMETRRSELLVITSLHRSGCLFWVLRVLAMGTHKTKVFYFYQFDSLFTILSNFCC